MKTIKILSIALLLLVSSRSYSTVHVINQSGFTFSPSNLNVNIGDVVKWVWSAGSHTTTSKSVPSGAIIWNSPLTSSVTSFEYTVTVAGTYSYVCTPHESMGMVGSFTAVDASTGINENSLPQGFSVYPNPAKSFINLKTDMIGEVVISNILGKTIKGYQSNELPTFNNAYMLDLSNLESGVYIISLLPSNSKKRASIKFLKE